METNEILKIEQKLVFVLLGSMGYNQAFEVAAKNEILHDLMKDRIVSFKFLKQNGEERLAIGTLNPRFIERAFRGKGVRKVRKETQVYWDVERNEWRSFRVENLISIL
jgi:S-adenosylmethionine:tRNA-ribosyltransferase-isomerase (queuine synthetase)